MGEPQRGKATKALEQLMSRQLSEEEIARRKPTIPDLRLREDAPAIAVDEATPFGQVLVGINNETSGALVVRRADGAPAAVVMSLDRYMGLVGLELANTARKVATLDGRLVPAEEAFAASHVEQIDPQAAWKQYGDAR
jgi:hypothetical protein